MGQTLPNKVINMGRSKRKMRLDKFQCSCCRKYKPVSEYWFNHTLNIPRSRCNFCINKQRREQRLDVGRIPKPRRPPSKGNKYYCTKCCQYLPKAAFCLTKGKVNWWCRKCCNWLHRLYKYGVRLEDYLFLYKLQHSCCALCGNKLRRGFTTTVDHYHVQDFKKLSRVDKRQHIRGLLCRHCNTGLGFLESSPFLLSTKVHKYLTMRPLKLNSE